jgi:hypothetical protein
MRDRTTATVPWGGIAIVLFFIVAIGTVTALMFEPEVKECTTVKLTTMKDNIVTQGNFFMGTGSIDGESKYFFYEEREDGSYTLGSVDTYSEYDGYDWLKPRVFQEDRTDAIVNKCIFRGAWTGWKKGYTVYDFHIPKGYRLDAE